MKKTIKVKDSWIFTINIILLVLLMSFMYIYMKDENLKIKKEHQEMTDELLSVSEKVQNLQNYIEQKRYEDIQQIQDSLTKIQEEVKINSITRLIKQDDIPKVVLASNIKSEKLETIVNAIAHVESTYNPKAVNGDAVGLLQIRPCVIEDLNNWGHNYKLSDRYDVHKSVEMFEAYTGFWLSYYNFDPTHSNRARIWNGGPRGPHKSSTQEYWDKVKERIIR